MQNFYGVNYPSAPSSNTIDHYYGAEVTDLYRALENLEDPQTVRWLETEADLTKSYFNQLAKPKVYVKDKLTTLWHYPKFSVLSKEGQNYFSWRLDFDQTSSVQNQPVLYRQTNLESILVTVLDPNQIDSAGNTAVTGQFFSPDGALLVYALAYNGSDWQELRIRRICDGYDYAETLTGCKAVNIAWQPDNSGFFYNRFVATNTNLKQANPDQSCIYWHTIGTDQTADTPVFSGEDINLAYYPISSQDGCYLILYACQGTASHNQIYYREMASSGPFTKLLSESDARYVFIGCIATTFYVLTTLNAPQGRIIAINLNSPDAANWQTIIAEQSDSIAFAILAGGHLVVGYLHNAFHLLKIYWLDGTFESQLNLPPFVSVTGISGKVNDPELFISLESFTAPVSVFRYDFNTAALDCILKPAHPFNSKDYVTRQVFFPAEDGVNVPLFITCKHNLKLDGNQPTLLTVYGGFGISFTPVFLTSHAFWLEQGGVLAVANIRGGGELGDAWHAAGRLDRKQNTIDDASGAARWLIRNSYAKPAKLAIMGHSNGGLTAAACAVQHPELFGAVVCQAPLTDMLRYHKSGAGHNWIPEYGNAEASLEEFKFLRSYSPLHNVKKAAYPAILISVALTDERVHPLHSLKFAAALQNCNTGSTPVLLRIEWQGGHGLGKAASQVIAELTDIYSFLLRVFKMPTACQPE